MNPSMKTETDAHSLPNAMNRCWRLYSGMWETDAQFEITRAYLLCHRTAVDEVLLFLDDITLGLNPDDSRLRRHCEIAATRMDQLRSDAIGKAGNELLATLGHGDVCPVATGAESAFQGMVGPDGRVSSGCACPNDERFRSLLASRIALAAGARPDFLYVEDDFQLVWHGAASYACFCPICLAKFGWAQNREALVAELNSPARGALRREWSEFMARTMVELCEIIRAAVRGVDPGIELGLMCGGFRFPTYGGHQLSRWVETLDAVRLRPGDGFYDDDQPGELIRKFFDVGMQIRHAGPKPRHIYYEQEAAPYDSLRRSAAVTVLETELMLFAGCNGVAFNFLPQDRMASLQEYEPHARTIVARGKRWQELASRMENTRWGGLWLAHSGDLMARRRLKDGDDWFANAEGWPFTPTALGRIGVPLTRWREHACGTVLAGAMVDGLDDAEIEQIVASGVLLDAEALEVLWERGFGELATVRMAQTPPPPGCRELATAHPLNGVDAGSTRNAQFAAMATGVDGRAIPQSLVAIDDTVEVLARLVDVSGGDYGPTLTLHCNRLGGRIAVATFSPWTLLGRAWKRRQTLAVANWISAGALPLVIETHSRILPVARIDERGETVAIGLLNTGFDTVNGIHLRIRSVAPGSSLRLLDDRGESPVECRPSADDIQVVIPSLGPWSLASIVVDRSRSADPYQQETENTVL